MENLPTSARTRSYTLAPTLTWYEGSFQENVFVTIENGMISAISSTLPAAAETETEQLVREIVDLPGYALIPGI